MKFHLYQLEDESVLRKKFYPTKLLTQCCYNFVEEQRTQKIILKRTNLEGLEFVVL